MFGLNREDALGLQEDLHRLRSGRRAAEAADMAAEEAEEHADGVIRRGRMQTAALMGVAVKLKLKDNAIMQERAKLEQALRENQAVQQSRDSYRVKMNDTTCATNAGIAIIRKLTAELALYKGTTAEEEYAEAKQALSREYDQEVLESKAAGYVAVDLRQTAAKTYPWYVPEA